MIKKTNILIIAEGYEEKPYLDKILNFPTIRNDLYNFKVINCKGSEKIYARYQVEVQKDDYELILVFCDADKGASTLIRVMEKVGKYIFADINLAKEVFIFANPVTMLLVLSHFAKVNLTNVGKKSNADIIEKLTGIANYDAKQEQIEEMMQKINFTNYKVMKENIKDISANYLDTPSTNFLKFIKYFESENTDWVKEIRNKLLNK